MSAFCVSFCYRSPDGATHRSRPYVVAATTLQSARVCLALAFRHASTLLDTPYTGASGFCQCVEVPTPPDEYESDALDRILAVSLSKTKTH